MLRTLSSPKTVVVDMVVLLVVVCLCRVVDGHVALTFPPARRYDLDFLDNGRTKAPCGMPKGNIVTSLPRGASINVTWHLAYPHRGGFQLELLDQSEKNLVELTPTSPTSKYVGLDDSTAQSYTVSLPSSLTCRGCILRLVRQAQEWGHKYLFWSCADVDIVPPLEFTSICSGHGKLDNGLCSCDKLYSGNVCQYKDECWNDEDCGGHGKCINIDATTYPKMQCFCEFGWYGDRCTKESPVKTTNIDITDYSKRDLSQEMTLYWKILKESNEIEAIIRAKSTNYVAVGWRPKGITAACKAFPLVEDKKNRVKRDVESDIKTKSEKLDSETTSEPEPTGKPEPNSEPEPTGKHEPNSEPEPTGKPEPNSEPEPTGKPEPNSEPEPTGKPESKSEPEPTGKPEPNSEPEPTGKPEPKSEPEPTGKPEPNSEPEPTGKPEPNSEPEPTGKPEPKSEPEPTGKPEPNSEPEPTGKPEPNSEPEPTGKPEPNSEPEPTGKHEPNSEPEPTGKPEPNSEPEPTGKPEPKSEAEPTGKPEPKSEPEPTGKLEPNSEPEPTTSRNFGAARKLDEKGRARYPPQNSYTPKADFHAMDCTDIVIGMARGSLSRVFDTYTRDRSTPRFDSYYGGQDDLTAALGAENNGETIIFFRKRLHATELTDHTIENKLMEVIWARGQEPNKYFHRPTTGLEAGKAKIKDFYRPDELKYHGHGTQRGKTIINFFEENVPKEISGCRGEWKFPPSCTGLECEYHAVWKLVDRTDEVSFVIRSRHSDSWTGIGFSKDTSMLKSDAIIGWIDPTGRITVFDTWINDYSAPMLDTSQDVYNISGERQDGMSELRFVRKRLTADVDRDFHFTDNECLYMFFPVAGGSYNAVSKRIGKHIRTPSVSAQKVCIYSCEGKPTTPEPETPPPVSEPEPTVPASEPEPSATNRCEGEWSEPPGCYGYTCTYRATWKYLEQNDEILFTVGSKDYNKWIGIGFSKNKAMVDTDAIIGWIDEAGREFIMDTWLQSYGAPTLDVEQNVYNKSGWREDGFTTLRFVRKRHTGDNAGDLQFTKKDCLYMIYPVRGGNFNAVNKKIRRHEATPKISDEPICIHTCQTQDGYKKEGKPYVPVEPAVSELPAPEPEPTEDNFIPPTYTTTTAKPTIKPTKKPTPSQQSEFKIVVKLPNSWRMSLKEAHSRESNALKQQLANDMNAILGQLTNFKNIKEIELDKSESNTNDIIAKVNVLMESSTLTKGGRNVDGPKYQKEEIEATMNATVESGWIGSLPVDPAFLIVSPVLEGNSGSNEVADSDVRVSGLTDEQVKLYVIIAGVLALGLLVLIQASCMIYRDKKLKKRTQTKEKLITNSNWKDYSATASSNYSYENFAMRDEDGKISKHPVGSVTNGKPKPTNGTHQKDHHSKSKTLPNTGHSATFERMSKRSDGLSNFSGYSSAYATHDRSTRSATSSRRDRELSPDFYFMPHQRRYSGEVVRVYVDYNNPEYHK